MRIATTTLLILTLAAAAWGANPATGGQQNRMSLADEPEPLGIAMENYEYPHTVHFLPLRVEGHDVRMGYMDVRPEAFEVDANGQTVTLLHGKNFFGAYWQATIEALAQAGYRVVVPDQVGFGKSSKPDVHYSFHMLARNTKMLLDELGVERTAVVGHSMGGMLATRFALMYPETTTGLILENPIGLRITVFSCRTCRPARSTATC
ncbi:MAG: alpha/beta fold hydrolase [Planctomycetota bacterium]